MKQIVTLQPLTHHRSHPIWVHGLKLMIMIVPESNIRSHPIWVRGLKRVYNSRSFALKYMVRITDYLILSRRIKTIGTKFLAKKLGFRSKMLYLCRNISGARLYENKLSIALLVGILIPTHLQCVYRIANPDERENINTEQPRYRDYN